MYELKSVRSGDRESGRIMGFKSGRYFLKAVFWIIWAQDRIISTGDRTFLKVTVWFGESTKESKLIFTEDEAQRRASNDGPFHGNYVDK